MCMIFRKKLTSFFGGSLLASFLCLTTTASAQQESTAVADSVVNTRYNEIKPIVSSDGKNLYFTRSNHPLNSGGRRDKGDVWVAQLGPKGEWTAVQRASNAINTAQMNMVIGFSANGEDLYFQTYDTDSKGKRQSGIYKMRKNGGSPKPVTIHYFFNGAKYQDATISRDGKTMLLSLESYSTYGLEDLYVSFLQPDGSWSEPKNLGHDINTPKQEMSAWLSEDGNNLFFASNGHGGSGSFDIFRSVRLDGSWKRWSKPENLGSEVNTSGSDFYYSEGPNQEWAYYSSTQNSEGFGDIRKVPAPEKEEKEPIFAEEVDAELEAEPLAQQTETEPEAVRGAIEDVTVLVRQSFDLEGDIRNEQGDVQQAKVRINATESAFNEESVSDGSFKVSLPEAGEYQLRVQSKGYLPVDTLLQVREGTNTLALNLRPIKVGETVRLQNVMFRQSTAVLMDESNDALDEIVEMMKENPQMEILLTGHTDNQGNSKANIRLSRERVEAVMNYLISRGISESRIAGKGYGGTRPIASNASEETRRLNRRVEFVITKN